MEHFDEFAGDYDALLHDPLRDLMAPSGAFFIQQKCRIVSRRLRRVRGSPRLRVLDAGCGRGTAFAFFGEDVNVVGTDVSLPMLRHAVKHGPVSVQEPYRLPFADGTFDAVYAFCIYHHIPEEHHVLHLRELRRVVAENGDVMVFEHNPYNPVTARIFARAPIDQGCRMIPPAALRATFRAAGFDELNQGFLLFVPQRLHHLLGFLEPRLSWLPLGGQYFVAGTKRAARARDEVSTD
jgi:SAM-dependent methyltransferase